MMQYVRSRMPSVRSAKREHYAFIVGVFVAVCVFGDLLMSCLRQLSEAQQQSTIILVTLSAAAFLAGSVNAQRKKAGAGDAKAAPAKKMGQAEAREASRPAPRAREAKPAPTQPAEAKGTTRLRLSAQAKPWDPSPATQAAEPQPQSPEKQPRAPRYAGRGSAGAKATTASGDATEVDAHVVEARRVIEEARREGLESSESAYPALMLACIRSNDVDMALQLFDQILEKYMSCDYKPTATVPVDTRSRFFSFVAGHLDDKRLRQDGLQILVAVRDHGIQPPHILQNRLVCAWGCKLPDPVLNYFKNMREEGFALSSAACRCLMADMISTTSESEKRTPLRTEASTFVPNYWEGPWQVPSLTSMLCSPTFYPAGPCDDFQQMVMQQMGARCDECTTVILRNLPCPFLREDLIKEMDAKGFAGLYNFVYLPVDFQTEMGMGYAFVNLLTTEEVRRFMLAFNGFRDWPRASAKICVVDLSRTQGLEANIGRYQNSPVMGDEVPERFQPVLFDGMRRIPFPEPTRELPKVFHKSIEW